jgi:hypothetical protein
MVDHQLPSSNRINVREQIQAMWRPSEPSSPATGTSDKPAGLRRVPTGTELQTAAGVPLPPSKLGDRRRSEFLGQLATTATGIGAAEAVGSTVGNTEPTNRQGLKRGQENPATENEQHKLGDGQKNRATENEQNRLGDGQENRATESEQNKLGNGQEKQAAQNEQNGLGDGREKQGTGDAENGLALPGGSITRKRQESAPVASVGQAALQAQNHGTWSSLTYPERPIMFLMFG